MSRGGLYLRSCEVARGCRAVRLLPGWLAHGGLDRHARR